jgi:hypothetical protein
MKYSITYIGFGGDWFDFMGTFRLNNGRPYISYRFGPWLFKQHLK